MNTAPARVPPGGRVARFAALLFFAGALGVFARPMLQGKVLFPADFLRGRAPFSLSTTPANQPAFSRRRHQGDVVQSVVPFQIHGRAEWRAGRIPLWIHSQLGGTPFLANDGGALFPGHLLGAAFPRSAVLTVAALFRLALCGAGMVFLLRHWGLDPPAQALGAVAYSFSYMILFWLAWPVSNSPVLLPWLVLATEHVRVRPAPVTLAALGACVGLTFLGGQTQMSGQIVLACGVFLGLRILVDRTPPRTAAVVLAAAAGGVALGVALAAVHLVPFLELLLRSAIWTERPAVAGPLPLSALRQWVAPDAWGNLSFLASRAPGPPAFDPAAVAQERFNGYVGLSTLALIPAAFMARGRRALVGALAVFLALYVCTIYGIGLHVLARSLPLLKLAYLERMLFVPAFAAAALAAVGVQSVLEGRTPRWMLGACAAVLVALSLVALATTACPYPVSRGSIPIACAIGAGAAAVIFFRADERPLLAWLVAGIVTIELLATLSPQNQWSAPADVYPLEPAMRPLTAETGGFLASYDGLYPPSMSAAYGIRDLRAYEPLVTRRWRSFYDRLDPSTANMRTTLLTLAPHPDWSRVAGIDRYLLGASPTAEAGWRASAAPPAGPPERLKGTRFSQTVRCAEGRAHQLQFVTGHPQLSGAVRVVRLDGGEVPVHDVVPAGRGTFLARFAQAVPCPATLRLEFDAGAETVLASWKTAPEAAAAAPLLVDGIPNGGVALAAWIWSHPLHASRAEWLGPLVILHLEARPFAWFPDRVVKMAGDAGEAAALDRVAAEIADPAPWAVLETEDPAGPASEASIGTAGVVSVARSAPGALRVDVKVASASGRWLVLQESWDPGWTVEIDGSPASLVPANSVFQAVAVPPGAHRVELRYRPRAFRLGAMISALAAGILVALVLIDRRRQQAIQATGSDVLAPQDLPPDFPD